MPIAPTTSPTNPQRPRTFTYVKRRSGFSITLRTDIIEDPDIQILDVFQLGHPTTTIINIYNDAPSKQNSILFRLRHLDLPHNHPVIISGDFNLHHPLWSADDVTTIDPLTQSTVDWLSGKGFLLLNDKGMITHPARHGQERASVIDLSFTNGPANTNNTFHDWAINANISGFSDHYGIQFTIDHGCKEIDNIFGIKYSLKEVNPDVWKSAFTKAALERPDLSLLSVIQNPSHADLDNFAELLTETFQAATASSAEERRPSSQAKPWWDAELSNLARFIADTRLLQKELATFDPTIQSRIKKSRNFFKKLCRFKKRDWANTKLQNATTDEIWKFPNWSKGMRNYPTPPIYRGNNLSKATTPEEKGAALRKELFQPPPPLEAFPAPDFTFRSPEDLPFTELAEEELSSALFDSSNISAPGPSQTCYQVIKWAWSLDEGRSLIHSLVRKCLATGYHPKIWRKATAVALRKPNKPDYSNPRAYRLITLLGCLGKLLEKVVAHRLTFLASKLLTTLVAEQPAPPLTPSSNDIQAAWNSGRVTSALTFDIKGYFDFVNHNRLLHELRRKHLPLEYIKWTASFLSNREAAVCIDGIRGPMHPVENGIPQGSPVSPILAAFYTAELLEMFAPSSQPSTFPHPDQATDVDLLMYVDDGKLYVSSNSLVTNTSLLKMYYYKTTTWLKSAGLSPDIAKREIMHYSRRSGDNSAPSITLQDDDGIARTIAPTATTKWLGVYFDRRLRFEHHAKFLAAKGENAVSSFTMLANTVRGLSHSHLRQL